MGRSRRPPGRPPRAGGDGPSPSIGAGAAPDPAAAPDARRRLDRGGRQDKAQARVAQLEAVIEAVADSLAVYDPEGRVVLSNSAYRAQLARVIPRAPAATLRGRYAQVAGVRDAWGAPLPEERWPEVRVLRGETLTGADAVEMVVGTPTGEDLHFSITGAPLLDRHGHIVGAVCASRDVTERRRLERRTRAALEALLEMAGALVSPDSAEPPVDPAPGARPPQDETLSPLAALCGQVLGCDRVAIVVADPRTERLRRSAITGSTSEQAVRWRAGLEGISLMQRFDAATLARLRAGEATLIEMEDLATDDPAHVLSRRHFLVAPMLAEGALAGYVGVHFGEAAADYTEERVALTRAVARLVGMVIERERLARDRADARARELALLAANQQMDDFLGMAAHDLRSPVAAAKVTAESAMRRLRRAADGRRGDERAEGDAPNEQAERALQVVGRNMDRLTRLVDRLLDVSRIRTGRLDLQREPCDLARIARACVEEQRAVAPGRAISLEIQGAAAGAIPLVADADRVGQVLTNLLTNALRYAPADRPIDVSLSVEAGDVRVAVRDDGPGIAPDEQETIWARYERAADVARQPGAQAGLGLGLYISREIVERHGGRIGVESEPGKGATFWFTLPAAAPG